MTSWGVLGCADIAIRKLLPAIKSAPGSELTAVASRNADKAAVVAEKFDCAAVTGYQELLDRDDIDAVYLPLPSGLHAEWIGRALLAGKHVLAEKPLTVSAADTVRLVGLAEDRGLVLRENFMFCHHGRHAKVAELLADGAIGELRALEATFTIPARPPGDIRYDPTLGGGSLFDNGAYPIRTAQLFLGEELAVRGADLRYDAAHRVDTGGVALLRDESGVSASLRFGLDHGYECAYQLIGSTGRITVDRAYTPPAELATDIAVHTANGTSVLTVAPQDQALNSVLAFTEAIAAGDTKDQAMVRQANLVAAIFEEARRCSHMR